MADTAPEPISLDEAKGNLRVDTNADDGRIASLIVAAREQVEDMTYLVLTPRPITETRPELGRWIDLKSWPIQSVDAVRYPVHNVMTALPAGAWVTNLKAEPVRLLPAQMGWGVGFTGGLCRHFAPEQLPIEIDVTAGFPTTDDVPEKVKQAMHLLIAHWYSNRAAAEVGTRAAAVEIPYGFEPLLRRWTKIVI
ncbi:head-tail connector protein [Sphingomonas nostoxanthinifaciens]|uniref:head-tail connector protein n=1 Tax=Sphingomonas nostoxanthinifaciens TaxID=2872652 RepID=UPI001CC1E4C3|nr:head-tail connector protein [Sphingomonas nostoxanthinifaciens]UAK23665.1 head-tail connector protein [Sphingomonas nostoxanthinifaciens]